MTKITILGGGSYTWGPTFLRDIFATPELRGSTIVLEDILQDRVDLVYALGRKMIEDFQLDFQLEKTLSLEAALQGADFVILTITTGRLSRCARTWRSLPGTGSARLLEIRPVRADCRGRCEIFPLWQRSAAKSWKSVRRRCS